MKRILIVLTLQFTASIAGLLGQNFSENVLPCGNDLIQKEFDLFSSLESVPLLFSDSAIYKIPIVFHVYHDGEESNIKKSEILKYLSKLNERFRRLNTDTIYAPAPFLPYGADTKIEFALATIDPEGNCTDGITRNEPNSYWPPNKYLNVYINRRTIVRESFFCSRVVGGYAILPITSLPVLSPRDAVFITYGDLEGLTLTHEVGHWFGLHHLWSPAPFSGTPNPDCSQDDFVDDTPLQDNPTEGCPEFPYFTCDTILGNMFSNYMDYSGCKNMFTVGQKGRMWSNLNSNVAGRNNLWSYENIMETGSQSDTTENWCNSKPIASFGFGKYGNYWCYPDPIPFWDASYNGEPTEWHWTFEGGNPSTSDEQNPYVVYEVSGNYNVRLIASNSSGSDTVSRSIRITSLPLTPKYTTPELIEDFEDVAINFNEFYLFHDAGRSWELINIASHSGQNSISLIYGDSLSGIDVNIKEARSAFFTPQYDISQLENGQLSFYLAGTSLLSDSPNDLSRLGIFASVECSNIQNLIPFPYEFSWDSLKTYSGYELPQSGDWKKVTIQIPEEVFTFDKVSFAFRYYSNFDKDAYHPFTRLFIDDIGIEFSGTVATEELLKKDIWQVIPNPTLADEVKIKVESVGEINVFDINGSRIYTQQIDQEQRINLSNFPSGTYFINFRNKGYSDTKKLIVIK